ncbi:MAG: DDE-type integrase/transposase/recombinase [Treponema phagedenis]|uniref:DDE-type integrase/transposase/recombinase n=1 Tax=Treponema phagedenis TaxID=162 RepID=UPI0001F64053|nr:DDE-type integrase/transposase/recombinase [Treponema phagedenis]EFW39389.1 hypothetical protein HMPREF9554_00082 [Treponema phagedenis F0421]
MVTDISYFRVKDGWLYLSAILDLYNREIVAYVCSRHVDAKLAVDTVTHLAEKYSLKEVLLHSDQGATYTSHAYRIIRWHNTNEQFTVKEYYVRKRRKYFDIWIRKDGSGLKAIFIKDIIYLLYKTKVIEEYCKVNSSSLIEYEISKGLYLNPTS